MGIELAAFPPARTGEPRIPRVRRAVVAIAASFTLALLGDAMAGFSKLENSTAVSVASDNGKVGVTNPKPFVTLKERKDLTGRGFHGTVTRCFQVLPHLISRIVS